LSFLSFLQSIFGKPTPKPVDTTIGDKDAPCDIRKVRETAASLTRTDEEIQAYNTWRVTAACKNWKLFLKKEQEAFAKRCKMAECLSAVKFEQLKCCQNFHLVFDNKIHNIKDFTFLFDHFKDALLENGYQLHTSDVRTYHCSETKKETIERHYLKPKPILVQGEKIDQLFGNVTLVLHAKNGVPIYLACRSTHYRDANLYNPVRPMREMVACFVQ
jgi:hypothetical protein